MGAREPEAASAFAYLRLPDWRSWRFRARTNGIPAVSDRAVWLEESCPECGAVPGARCSRWSRGRRVGGGRIVHATQLHVARGRLEAALALASRTVVTPRLTADADLVGVRLIEAMRRRAVLMWRTHADAMPDPAAALTTLALADCTPPPRTTLAHGPWCWTSSGLSSPRRRTRRSRSCNSQRPRAGSPHHPVDR
jgi:hypothetical protein